MFYAKHVTKTLAEAITDHTGLDPDEQVSLYEELALMRHVAGNFVKLYGAAVESGDTNSISIAGLGMSEALSNVEKVCSSAAKIQTKQRDRFSVHDLKFVVNRITRILYEVCGPENEDIARRFKLMIDQHLVLPTGYQQGTTTLPDETIQDLDNTIPFVEEEDEDDDD